MSATAGYGSITFGSVIVGVYKTEAGMEYDGPAYVELECTVDTDTGGKAWLAGDTPDWGQLRATIFVTTDLDAIAGTTETLTWTLPNGDTKSGDAFLVQPPITAGQNVTMESSITFRWTGAVTHTVAP